MKERNSHIGLASICRLFGVTRQAYYQHLDWRIDLETEHKLVMKEVLQIRSQHPRIGTRKLYVMIDGFMSVHHIKMGRDALFNLLPAYNLLIRKRRRQVKTTHSHHRLIKVPKSYQRL